jgi:hypothetical protein
MMLPMLRFPQPFAWLNTHFDIARVVLRLKLAMAAGAGAGARAVAGIVASAPALVAPAKTEQIYLTGKGPTDAVTWDFTVTAGRRAEKRRRFPCLPSGSSMASAPITTAMTSRGTAASMACTAARSRRRQHGRASASISCSTVR